MAGRADAAGEFLGATFPEDAPGGFLFGENGVFGSNGLLFGDNGLFGENGVIAEMGGDVAEAAQQAMNNLASWPHDFGSLLANGPLIGRAINAIGDHFDIDPPGYAIPVNDRFNFAETLSSPLIFDLDGDGIELTPLEGSTVLFDLTADGFAERTGWVQPDDGFLALDRNGNGLIDDGSELFGSPTVDGFTILAELDTNNDQRIDSQDDRFGDLRVWRDLNGDGISDPGELIDLFTAGIAAIELGDAVQDTDIRNEGHVVSPVSVFEYTNGALGTIVDVFFQIDPLETEFVAPVNDDGSVTIPTDIAELPDLEGFGLIADLRQAMTLDLPNGGDLKALVETIEGRALENYGTSIATDITNLLFLWAGVEDVTPGSRGGNVDARVISFLEAFTGQDFSQHGAANPRPQAGATLTAAFDDLVSAYGIRLLLQSDVADTVLPGLIYDRESDLVIGSLDIEQIIDNMPTDQDDALSLLTLVKFAMAALVTERTLAPDYYDGDFDDLLALSSSTFDAEYIAAFADGRLKLGTELDDVLNGNGHTLFDGGEGNDTLYGGSGNDTYQFEAGDGSDTIVDVRGEDAIRFDESITPTDIDFVREGNDLVLMLPNTETIRIEGHFGNSVNAIEKLSFDDGTTLDLSGVELFIAGTAAADTLVGQGGSDTLSGGAGGDMLKGGYGADLYLFGLGDGEDTISDNSGADQIVLGTGITPEMVTLGRDMADLLITVGSSGDMLRVERFFSYSPSARIAGIVFADGHDSIDLGIPNGLATTGTEQNDTLLGDSASDVLEGMGGDDRLEGGNGDDLLIGGGGNDLLMGGSGSDVYVFGVGAGHDTISGEVVDSGVNVLQFDASVTATDFIISRNGNNLVIQLTSGDRVTVGSHLSGNQPVSGLGRLQMIRLADGTEINLIDRPISFQIDGTELNDSQLNGGNGDDRINGFAGNDRLYGYEGRDILNGGEDNDSLYGGSGQDTLNGGQGNDSLQGQQGDDVYVIGTSSGDDTISDGSSSDGGTDTILFTDATVAADLSFSRIGNSYHMLIEHTDGRTIELHNTYHWDADYRVEQIMFSSDASTLQIGSVTAPALGTSGNDNIAGVDGGMLSEDEIIYGFAGNDTLRGNNGADTLIGGQGNDSLQGQQGDDVYVIGAGSGNDTISDGSSSDGGTDTILFTDATVAADLSFSRIGNSYHMLIEHTDGRTIELHNTYHWDADYRVEQIMFSSDASTLQIGSVTAPALGTSGNDNIAGVDGGMLSEDEIIYGFAGNDTLRGNNGADTLIGGQGNDSLQGQQGDDVYVIGAGSGNDTISDGSSSDGGTDTILFTDATVAADLSFSRIGNSYHMLIEHTDGRTIELHNTYHWDADYRVEQIMFSSDASTLQIGSVTAPALGTSGNDNIAGVDGGMLSEDEIIYGFAGNDTLRGNNGADTLIGGQGNDSLIGVQGDDVYVIGASSGDDTISDGSGSDGGTDTILFTDATVAADLSFSRIGTSYHMLIEHTDGRTIEVHNQFHWDVDYKVENIVLDDETVIDLIGVATAIEMGA